MWTAIAISAVVVAGAVGYLIFIRRDDQKHLKNVQRQLWVKLTEVLQAKDLSAAEKDRIVAEIEALRKSEHEKKTQGVVERFNKK